MRLAVFGSCVVAAALVATAAPAATPREILISAAFDTRDKKQALAKVGQALAGAEATLARAPGDREAQLQRAMAIGYRAKLSRSPSDAKLARKQFEALVAADPRNAEAVAALACWHLDAVNELGSMMAGAVLGAKKADGLAGLDRALALGGNRALFPAVASLMRIQLNAKDVPAALRFADRAAKSAAPGQIDRVMQRNAAALLPTLRAGDGSTAQELARRMLPFGRIEG